MKVYLINTAYIIGMSPYQYPHGMKSNKYASRQENYKFYEEIRTSSHSAFLYYSSGSKIETVKRYWLIYASFLIDKILKIVIIWMKLEEQTHSKNETFQEKCVIWVLKWSQFDFFSNFDNFFDINALFVTIWKKNWSKLSLPGLVHSTKKHPKRDFNLKTFRLFWVRTFFPILQMPFKQNSIFCNENFLLHSQTEIESFIKNNCNQYSICYNSIWSSCHSNGRALNRVKFWQLSKILL